MFALLKLQVELKDSEKHMEHPVAVESPAGEKVGTAAASEVSKEPEIQNSSPEIVQDGSPAVKAANESPSDEAAGEATAPATPLKDDDISKEAVTEKSPEVGTGSYATVLVARSLPKNEVLQQAPEETHRYSRDKAIASCHTEDKSIVNRKPPSNHHLATDSDSLQSAFARFMEMKADLHHAMSNLGSITQSLKEAAKQREELEEAAKERDELRGLIEKLTSVPATTHIHSASAVDMGRLKLAAERVQGLIEQVSGQLLSYLESNVHDFMQPMWYNLPEVYKERYICFVVSQRMFSGFESENFMLSEGSSAILDLETLRNESMKKYLEFCSESAQRLMISDDLFSQFAFDKKAAVVKDVKKRMLDGAVNLSEALLGGDIWGKLDILAKEVWAMHKLSLSMEWRPRILRVRKGVRFDHIWMEAVNSPATGDEHAAQEIEVKFLVMPGFQVLDTLVSPCRVYVVV